MPLVSIAVTAEKNNKIVSQNVPEHLQLASFMIHHNFKFVLKLDNYLSCLKLHISVHSHYFLLPTLPPLEPILISCTKNFYPVRDL